jgi:hypothetical protein
MKTAQKIFIHNQVSYSLTANQRLKFQKNNSENIFYPLPCTLGTLLFYYQLIESSYFELYFTKIVDICEVFNCCALFFKID